MNQPNSDWVFARDLIQFVMQFHRPTWKFTKEFAIESDHTHFTENFANYIQIFIQENDVRIQMDYEQAFRGIEFTKDIFNNVGQHLNREIFKGEVVFCVKKFIAYCSIIAKYTVLSYIFGLKSAPVHAVAIICDNIKYLRNIGQFTNDTWCDIQKFVGSK
ncbi:hypothetical protein JTE90_023970 [Oedothorax gibbosus]|uniref:Uncharacterized protein n=1 Tax=Oedothorax gibbosus TaxID=931172 RepID=A0AAV6UGT5_9ARAC|nr:hypothetical protein JTE90_023970 [Oedothorax gibbosus]